MHNNLIILWSYDIHHLVNACILVTIYAECVVWLHIYEQVFDISFVIYVVLPCIEKLLIINVFIIYLIGWMEGMLFLVKFFQEWMLFTRWKLKEGKVALPRARLWLLTVANSLYKCTSPFSTWTYWRCSWVSFQFPLWDYLSFYEDVLIGLCLVICLIFSRWSFYLMISEHGYRRLAATFNVCEYIELGKRLTHYQLMLCSYVCKSFEINVNPSFQFLILLVYCNVGNLHLKRWKSFQKLHSSCFYQWSWTYFCQF